MRLRLVGFFRELRHGMRTGPSLADSVRSQAAEDEEKMVRYLKLSPTFAASGPLVDDVLDSSNKEIAPLETATDGQWMWPRDLAYYVERYHVELPTEFVNHMRGRDWQPPELSRDYLAELATEFMKAIRSEQEA